MNEPKTNFKPLWFPPDDELKELSAYRPKPLPEKVQILLNAGFTHTQIEALTKVGAIKP